MSKKIYVIKSDCGKILTTNMCIGTNDMSKYPVRVVDGVEKPVEVVARFSDCYDGKLAHITEDPIEIDLITKYLMKTQNPFFYDVDNPTNSRKFYQNSPEELR